MWASELHDTTILPSHNHPNQEYSKILIILIITQLLLNSYYYSIDLYITLSTVHLQMELVPTLSRRDRLHIAMRRQHLDNDAITTDGKTLTPNNNLTTNAASLGSNRSKQRKIRQKHRNQQTKQDDISLLETLESKGLHPIVAKCEQISNRIVQQGRLPTYMEIKSKLVSHYGINVFKQHKPLIVAVLKKIAPEHAEHHSRTTTRTSPSSSSSSSSLLLPSSESSAPVTTKSTNFKRSRRLSLTQLNRHLLHVHDRLREVFHPEGKQEDKSKVIEIWDALSSSSELTCTLASPEWVALGCPSGDPSEELSAAGQLAVDCLLTTIRKEKQAFRQMMVDIRTITQIQNPLYHNKTSSNSLSTNQRRRNNSIANTYPFLRCVVCITLRLCDVFGLCTFKGIDDYTLSSRNDVSVLQIPRAKVLSEIDSFEHWFVLSLKRFHRKMCLSKPWSINHNNNNNNNNVRWENILNLIMLQIEKEIDALIELEEARMRERSTDTKVSPKLRTKSKKTPTSPKNTQSNSNIETQEASLPMTRKEQETWNQRNSSFGLFHKMSASVTSMFGLTGRNRSTSENKAASVDIVWSDNIFSSTNSDQDHKERTKRKAYKTSNSSPASLHHENPMMDYSRRSSTQSFTNRKSKRGSMYGGSSCSSNSSRPLSNSSITSVRSELDGAQRDLLRLLNNRVQLNSSPYSSPTASPRHLGRRRSRMSVEKRISRVGGRSKRSSLVRGGRGSRSSLRSSVSVRSSLGSIEPINNGIIPPPPPRSPKEMKIKSLVNLLHETWEDDDDECW